MVKKEEDKPLKKVSKEEDIKKVRKIKKEMSEIGKPKRNSSLLSLIILFTLLIVVLIIGYLLIEPYFAEIQKLSSGEDNTPIVSNEVSDNFPKGILFYQDMRFPTRRITYHINESCTEKRIEDAKEAFNILQDNTILVFIESQVGDIEVSCSENTVEPKEEYFIAGEGGPSSIINTTGYYVIGEGTILLYKDSTCAKPVIAIHEILHVLGFTHSINKNSIMYDISNCKQKITNEVINKINDVYKDPTFPDLIVSKASANKKSRLLDFEVEVLNAGLSKSDNSSLVLFIDGEEITSYQIDGLEIGNGRLIRVSSLRVPRNFKELSFFIDPNNLIFEINENNNEFTLSLE